MIASCRIGDGYVIEKVDRQNHEQDVMVSFWKDVRNAIPQGYEVPLYRLEYLEDFQQQAPSTAASGEGSMDEPVTNGFTMAQLYQMAVGDAEARYDEGNANCHHIAQAVFNHCASDRKRVEQIPNSFLTGMPLTTNHATIYLQL